MEKLCVLVVLSVVLTMDLVVGDADQERKVIKACQEKTKAPKSALEKLNKMENLDDSKEGKCFLWCILESYGAIKDDGSINNEVAEKYFKETFGAKSEKVNELWEECQEKDGVVSAKGDDLCHYSYSLLQCFYGDLKKEKIQRESR